MVEVPEDATSHYFETPDGTWRIHSDSLTITEEQAGEIVEKSPNSNFFYNNYEFTPLHELHATDSYRSLLRSKQINSRVINLVRI
jgi:hypothetical protein